MRTDMVPLASLATEMIPARTLTNWATRGVRGVVLESRMVGGRRFSPTDAVERFLDRLNEKVFLAQTERKAAP